MPDDPTSLDRAFRPGDGPGSGPRAPLVGLPACSMELNGLPYHRIGDKYVRAVAEAAGAVPLVFPALGELAGAEALLERLDGLLFTGSPSNVHPRRYGADADPRAEPHDEARDATTLPLYRAAVARGLPVFAICRGFQELNVAYGGSLHARLHELPGRLDHRRPQGVDVAAQYAPRHDLRLTPGGRLAELLGELAQDGAIRVNSLHGQGVDRLADGLALEAVAPDGTVEAVSVAGAPGFALGVQWHPEYRPLEDPVSTALFRAFGAAVRAHAARRSEPAPVRPAGAGAKS